MSAIAKSVAGSTVQPNGGSTVNSIFLALLPKVETHAGIQFRSLPAADHEEALAEARAAAFVIVHSAVKNGNTHRLSPSTVARYAVLHVKGGGHVGSGVDARRDAMSRKARRQNGFSLVGLGRLDVPIYNCLIDAGRPVWGQRLLHDRRTNPADQAAFRIDMSAFLAGQADRTRTLLSLLAAGHKSAEAADRMGITPAAISQRRKRALREWERLQNGATQRARVGEMVSPLDSANHDPLA